MGKVKLIISHSSGAYSYLVKCIKILFGFKKSNVYQKNLIKIQKKIIISQNFKNMYKKIIIYYQSILNLIKNEFFILFENIQLLSLIRDIYYLLNWQNFKKQKKASWNKIVSNFIFIFLLIISYFLISYFKFFFFINFILNLIIFLCIIILNLIKQFTHSKIILVDLNLFNNYVDYIKKVISNKLKLKEIEEKRDKYFEENFEPLKLSLNDNLKIELDWIAIFIIYLFYYNFIRLFFPIIRLIEIKNKMNYNNNSFNFSLNIIYFFNIILIFCLYIFELWLKYIWFILYLMFNIFHPGITFLDSMPNMYIIWIIEIGKYIKYKIVYQNKKIFIIDNNL